MTEQEQFHSPEGFTEFVTRLASKHSMVDFNTKLGTMGLGLAGEAGEVAKLVKFKTYEGKTWDDADHLRVIDELSDICWYVAFAAGNVVETPFRYLRCDVPVQRKPDPAGEFRTSYVGLMQSCGGIADVVKKLLFHGKPYNDQVRLDLIERLRSVMASVAIIASDVCGVTVDEIIKHNVAKLSERYKGLQFTTEEFMAKERAQCETSPSP